VRESGWSCWSGWDSRCNVASDIIRLQSRW